MREAYIGCLGNKSHYFVLYSFIILSRDIILLTTTIHCYTRLVYSHHRVIDFYEFRDRKYKIFKADAVLRSNEILIVTRFQRSSNTVYCYKMERNCKFVYLYDELTHRYACGIWKRLVHFRVCV